MVGYEMSHFYNQHVYGIFFLLIEFLLLRHLQIFFRQFHFILLDSLKYSLSLFNQL